MRYKKHIALALALATVILLCWAVAAGGDASDPVISKSYLEETLGEKISDDIVSAVEARLENPENRISEISRNAQGKINNQGLMQAAVEVAAEELQARGKFWYNAPTLTTLELKSGEVICGEAGTKVILFSGNAEIYGNPVVNITAGYEYQPGAQVVVNNSYFFTENNGSGILFNSDAAIGVEGSYKILKASRTPRYTDLAEALSEIGLVRGTAKGFELNRGATRAEAITMLVRLLAEENAANATREGHPFTDVDSWADKIIAYSYKRGYANGVSYTKFGAKSPTTVNHYMTFILRALGYDDTKGDFTWSEAMDFAVETGVITKTERDMIVSTPFTRDHMVYLSYYALFAEVKGENKTLLDTLIDRGAVSRNAADRAIARVDRNRG